MKQSDVDANIDGARRRRTQSKRESKSTSGKPLHGSIRRILVPVDFSLVSLNALDFAAKRARECGAEILLLHVLDPVLTQREFLTPRMRTLKAEARRETRKRLALLMQRRIEKKVASECWILEGEPSAVINAAAEKAGCDLIVMGSVGRKGIGRFLLGSVAERVVREAVRPITIVPPLGRRTESTLQTGTLTGGKRGAAVVLIGPPGSGKTTVAHALRDLSQTTVIEVGNLLRDEVERGTTLGKSIDSLVRAGRLVPLEAVDAVVSDALANVQDNVVLFDGIPRTKNQIIPFLETLVHNGFDLFAVVIVNVDAGTAVGRLSGRRICSRCGRVYNIYKDTKTPSKNETKCEHCGGNLIQRNDDRKEVAEARWKQFERETLPVIEFFKKELGRMTLEISGTSLNKRSIDRIRRELKTLVPQMV